MALSFKTTIQTAGTPDTLSSSITRVIAKPPRINFGNILSGKRRSTVTECMGSAAEKRLVLVMGGTGLVGGAVVRGLLSYPWFCVLVATRRPWCAEAVLLKQAGARLVEVDYNYKHSLVVAMRGVTSVFLHTNYWENYSCTMEIAHGRNMVDAALEAGVEHVVYNGTNYVKPQEGRVCSFLRSKLEIEDYIRESGLAFTIVVLPFYFENFLTVFRPFEITPDLFAMTMPLENCLISCACLHDMALCICKIIQQGSLYMDHKLILAAEMLSVQQMTMYLSQGLSGLQFIDPELTVEDFVDFGFPGSKDLAAMFHFFQICEDIPDFSVTRTLNPHTRTMMQWVDDNSNQLYEVLDEAMFSDHGHHTTFRQPPHLRQSLEKEGVLNPVDQSTEWSSHASSTYEQEAGDGRGSYNQSNNSTDPQNDGKGIFSKVKDLHKYREKRSSVGTYRARNRWTSSAAVQKFLEEDFAALQRRLGQKTAHATTSLENSSKASSEPATDHSRDQRDATQAEVSGDVTRQAEDKETDKHKHPRASPSGRRWSTLPPGKEEIPMPYHRWSAVLEEGETPPVGNALERGQTLQPCTLLRKIGQARARLKKSSVVNPPSELPQPEEVVFPLPSQSPPPSQPQPFEVTDVKPASALEESIEMVTKPPARTLKWPPHGHRMRNPQGGKPHPPSAVPPPACRTASNNSNSNRSGENRDQECSALPVGTFSRLALLNKWSLLRRAFHRAGNYRKLDPDGRPSTEVGQESCHDHHLDKPCMENEDESNCVGVSFEDTHGTTNDEDDTENDYCHPVDCFRAPASELDPLQTCPPPASGRETTTVTKVKNSLPSSTSVTEGSSSDYAFREEVQRKGSTATPHRTATRTSPQQQQQQNQQRVQASLKPGGHWTETDAAAGTHSAGQDISTKCGGTEEGPSQSPAAWFPYCDFPALDACSFPSLDDQFHESDVPPPPSSISLASSSLFSSTSSFGTATVTPPSPSSEKLLFSAWRDMTREPRRRGEKWSHRHRIPGKLESKMYFPQTEVNRDTATDTSGFPQFCWVSSSPESWGEVQSGESGMNHRRPGDASPPSVVYSSSTSYGSILFSNDEEGKPAGRWYY